MAPSARLALPWRLFGALAVALGATALVHHPAHASIHRAALVIEHASGRLVTRCINFVEDQITGLQLIQRSGVSYQTQGFGSLGEAICQLDGEPVSVPPHCFGSGPYWQYFHGVNGRWTNSGAGASNWFLRDGDMDGWHYAAGAGQAPPTLTFSQVCVTPVARPAPAVATPQPAPTPSASAFATASPSVTALLPTPSATPTPRPPASPSAAEPLGVLGASLLILAGLTAWNLWRRGP